MDEPEPSPLAPLPIGDSIGAPAATPDALRQILRRHRRRQTAIGGAGLAAVLVAGSFGGWAVGRHDRGSGGGVRIAAGGQPTAAPQAASPHGPAPDVGSAVAGSAPIGEMGTSQSTQLVVRNAADGTRVRLYEQSFGPPKLACGAGQTCAQPSTPICGPTSLVAAEVSDDQVAGQTENPLWQATPAGALELVGADVIGSGQPQPILVVVAKTATPTAKVTLTTSYGSDVETPTTAGWVGLAVRLPADFTTDGTGNVPAGTVTAVDAGGQTVSTSGLTATQPLPPACRATTCVSTAVAIPTPPGSSAPDSAPLTSAVPPVAATVSGCPCTQPMVKAPPGASVTVQAPATCSVSVGGTVISGGAGGSATGAAGAGPATGANSSSASSGPASTTP